MRLTTIATATPQPPAALAPRRAMLLAAWVVCGISLLGFLSWPPTGRSQEARVLETAREMAGHGARAWLLPRINGKLRLEKPPLAYWLAAGSFKVLGVSEFAGRLPFALCGWLLIALIYRIGAWLFDERVGLLAAACAFGQYMLFRYFRLAETDGLATLFVTAGVYWHWKGALASQPRSTAVAAVDFPVSNARQVIDFHLGAAAMGLAVLAKGPPAAYVLLFFLLWIVVERNWRGLLAYVRCAAPLTALIIALPWYLYIRAQPESRVVAEEFATVLKGVDHPGHFWQYFWQLLEAVAPWPIVIIAAIVAAVGQWRKKNTESQTKRFIGLGLWLWFAAVFVPLCLVGQKQFHYLMPALPPLAILGGWFLAGGNFRFEIGDLRLAAAARLSMVGTGIVIALAGIAVVLVAHQHRELTALPLLLAAGALAAGGVIIVLSLRIGPGAGAIAAAGALAVLYPMALSLWMPSLNPENSQVIAASLHQQFGDGPYCFYGPNESLSLGWALREEIPHVTTSAELEKLLASEPNLIVLGQEKSGLKPPPPPANFHEARQPIRAEGQVYRVYLGKG